MQCFYDGNSCLNRISDRINRDFPINFTRLNSSRPSRFAIDVTVENLLENFFIDSWSTEIKYSSYLEFRSTNQS